MKGVSNAGPEPLVARTKYGWRVILRAATE